MKFSTSKITKNLSKPSDLSTFIESQSAKKYKLSKISNKSVEVSYTGESMSANAGLLLLKQVADQTGLIEKLSACIDDQRDSRYITHTVSNLLTQRIFQIALGYEDGNDSTDLRHDALFKISLGQLPNSGNALASQPTMSRFENAASNKDLYRIGQCFVDQFISSYAVEPNIIILDLDDTNSDGYGNQEGLEYNSYYKSKCLMPLHIYEGISGKLITTLLKPGRRSKSVKVFRLLKRLINKLRQKWKQTIFIVRGDTHFCSSDFMDWAMGENHIYFITGLAGNSVLHKKSEITRKSAQNWYDQHQKTIQRFHSFTYQAASWKQPQRVVVKAEHTSKGMNVRYVVTNIPQQVLRTQKLYKTAYCQRGNAELRIKDHKELRSDKMSCSLFKANQFRLFLYSAAYVLLHTLQNECLKATSFEDVTFKTLRDKLLKTTAQIIESKTKIKVILPKNSKVKTIQIKVFQIIKNLQHLQISLC